MSIKSFYYGTAKEFTFSAQYDNTIPEDQRFAKASPSGTFTIMIDNPIAADSYILGEDYYFDSTPISKEIS